MRSLCKTRARMVLLLGLLVALAAPAHARGLRVEGALTAVDQVSVPPTVTIAGVTVNVTADTEIEIFGHDATLAELATYIGQTAEAEYDSTTHIASKIEVSEEAVVVGTVTAVDALAGTITVALSGGTAVVLTVDPDTEFNVHGGDLEDVVAPDLSQLVGLRVRVEYDTATNVAQEVEVLARFRATAGTIAAVDAGAGTFALNTPRGALNFVVSGVTHIRLKGASGPSGATLADLATGDAARVQFASLNGVLVALDVQARAGGRPQMAVGVITAVDALSSRFTIQTRRSGLVTLTVDPATLIWVNGAAGTLADLVAGMRVTAQYIARGGANQVRRVMARSPGGHGHP
ncbi:MAG: hypothetical protein HY320_08320 [Armatimonadetes bacterium]|nr:hypothetical protein [Armatimonadota bacterium]